MSLVESKSDNTVPAIDSETGWDHPKLGIDKAREILNDLLGLTAIRPYAYRKGLGYMLRGQQDYHDPFMIHKFSRGRDVDWKPYVAKVLGFKEHLLRQKYEVVDEIDSLAEYKARTEKRAEARREEYDELRGRIEIRSAAARRLRKQIQAFSFRTVESEMQKRLVEEVEEEISRLNDRRYLAGYEIHEIERSLTTRLAFDPKRIERVFREARLAWPDGLAHSYEQLLEFNTRITEGRAKRLEQTRKKLSDECSALDARLSELDTERSQALSLLREQKTVRKYEALHGRLARANEEVLDLRRRLGGLDRVEAIQTDMDSARRTLEILGNEIRANVRKSNKRCSHIRAAFAEYVERVLRVPALLSVRLNRLSNLEFNIKTIAGTGRRRETSQSKGTSYLKLLCACFDMAVLASYSSDSFYRFVYHDGVLEGLDERKKRALLELVHDLCAEHDIQYILTVIDSDIPRDDEDRKMPFAESEIIKQLHDEGDEGRLFRMPLF